MLDKIFKQVLTYDISSNKLRIKVQKQVEEAGLGRLQKSVYAGTLQAVSLQLLISMLQETINDQPADIRIIYPCPHQKPSIQIVVNNTMPSPADQLLHRVYRP